MGSPTSSLRHAIRNLPLPDRRVVIGLVVAVALLGWFLSGVDGPALVAALAEVRPGWLALSALLILAEWVLRGVRWWILLRGLDRQGGPGAAVSATLAGAAANTLIPLRGGDLLRPAMVSLARDVPFAAALTSSVVDRLFDVAGIVGVLVLLLALIPAGTGGDLADIHAAVRATAIGGVVLIGLVAVAVSGPVRELTTRAIDRLPAGLRDRAMNLFDQLVAGLIVAGKPSRLAVSAGFTVVAWLAAIAAAAAMFRAFDLHLPVSAALLLVSTINVAISIPQGPGFVGLFQVTVERSLAVFDAPSGPVQAVAIAYWAASFVPVTLIGLFEAWRSGFRIAGRNLVDSPPPPV